MAADPNPVVRKRRLSQTLGQIRKNFAVDTYQGGFPIHQVMSIPHAPSAADADSILGAVTLDAENPTVVLSGDLTNPDSYRALSITGNQSDVDAEVVILGKDWSDETVRETIIASGTATVDGNFPFKTIDSITFPAQSASGQTVSVGVTDKLGFYRPIVGDVIRLMVDSTHVFNPTTDFQYGTVTVSGLNGFKHVELDYLTDIF